MKKASWIVLTVAGVALVLLSLVSALHAYNRSDNFAIGGKGVSRVANGDPAMETALRGIRGTSASYAVAFGVLFLTVVLGPYRRGEVWAWKALFAVTLVQAVIVLLRVPFLETDLGTSATLTQGIPIMIGLMLDVGRLRNGPRG